MSDVEKHFTRAIAAPLCFEVEDALQKRVSIPVFHDDQHGTAIALDGRMINNALAFPGLLRGTLDACAPRITVEMKCAAASDTGTA